MIRFSKEKVLLLHELIAKETGGDAGVRDFGLLESALESAYQTFDGKELFQSKEEKAAKLGFSLISNHAFVDGNKRIGMYVMLAFLEMNGIYISPTDDDVIDIGIKVASGKANYEDVLSWIKSFEKNNQRLGGNM
ncbi:MAG: type II toxin-antitoxin system death-on-curing family toxin [Ruminococcus sp.]|jgi:death-on-curing protein|nr:type II toxin-antitoxin system death-on-curing family toxin [Ruminococcus sp.]